MQKIIKDVKVTFIGDPHFGKKFSGIELSRRGEFEEIQRFKFNSLLKDDSKVCILMGDLFDYTTVSNEVLIQVFQDIQEAATVWNKKDFIIIAGNHDISRDSTKVSQFELLKELLKGYENVYFCISSPKEIITQCNLRILSVPYSPNISAKDFLAQYLVVEPSRKKFDLLVGHWDIEEISGEHNLIPLSIIKDLSEIIVSGHIHLPYNFYISSEGFKTTVKTDCEVIGSGSMLPYAHGEDKEGVYFITHSLEQVLENLKIDKLFYKNNFLRITLNSDEKPPEEIEAFQIKLKYNEVSELSQELEVSLDETFSLRKVFDDLCVEHKVDVELHKEIWEDLQKENIDD